MRANLGPEGQPHVDSAQESLLGFILMFLADLGNQGCLLSKHRFLGSSPKVLHYRVWNLEICIFNKFPVCLVRTEKHLEAKILTP